MPHGESWFSLLPFYQTLLAHCQPFLGETWVNHVAVTSIQHVLAALLVCVVVGLLAARARQQLEQGEERGLVPPQGLSVRNFIELICDALYQQCKQIIGADKARQYFPVIGSLALFIFFSNMIGLIPGFSPPTDNWNTTLACGLFVFIYYHYHGLKANGLGHLAHIINPVGTWWGWFLAPLMFPIEIVSHSARPLSLSLRLMGNMIGDHQVLSQISQKQAFFVPMPFFALGLIVCVVQTLVFTLLTMVYISLSVAHAEHDDAHHHESDKHQHSHA